MYQIGRAPNTSSAIARITRIRRPSAGAKLRQKYPESTSAGSTGFPNLRSTSRANSRRIKSSGLPPSAWRIKAVPKRAQITQDEEFWEASVQTVGISFEWLRPENFGPQTRLWKGLGADGTAAMNVGGTWTMRVDPDGNIGQFYTQNGGYNAGLAPVPEVEPLVIKARQTYDQQERKRLYSDIQNKAVEMLYSNVLLHYNVARAHASRKVSNFESFYGGEGKARRGGDSMERVADEPQRSHRRRDPARTACHRE